MKSLILSTVILISLIFSVLYPLYFWVIYNKPVKKKSYKFHLSLPNVAGGITLVFLLFMEISLTTKWLVVFWKAIFIAVSRFYWKREYPDPRFMSIPVLIGLYVFYRVLSELVF